MKMACFCIVIQFIILLNSLPAQFSIPPFCKHFQVCQNLQIWLLQIVCDLVHDCDAV